MSRAPFFSTHFCVSNFFGSEGYVSPLKVKVIIIIEFNKVTVQ